jgi:hypothetical protein
VLGSILISPNEALMETQENLTPGARSEAFTGGALMRVLPW